MRRPLICLAIASAITSSMVWAEPLRPSDFDANFALSDVVDGLNSVELTEPVYRAMSRRSLADLRVFNAAGEALPVAVLPPAPAAEPEVRVLALSTVPLPAERAARDAVLQAYAVRVERDRTRTVIELRGNDSPPTIGDAPAVGGLLIDARPLKDMHGRLLLQFSDQAANFAGQAQVLGSEDFVNWRVLAVGPLAREARFGDTVEKARFQLDRPPSFIRISWNGRAAPQLAGASFEQVITRSPTLPRARLATSLSDDRRSLFVEVPHALPIERLYLHTPQSNQSLRVTVYRQVGEPAPRRHRLGVVPRRAPESWVPIGTLDVFRITRDGVELEGPPLPFMQETDRLRIDANAPFPEPLPMVEAEWRPHRIAFAARAPGPYRIAAGSDDAGSGPPLDIASLLPADDHAGLRLPVARVDATAAVSSLADAAAQRAERIAAQSHWSRLLLWGVLAIAVLALAWMAWRIGAQLRNQPRADSPNPH